MNRVDQVKEHKKRKTKGKKRKKIWKRKLLFFEVVFLLVMILILIVTILKKQFFYEKEESPIPLHFFCQYANPWIPLGEEDFSQEIGQKRNKIVYHFDYVDETIKNSYAVDTYLYTTKDAYQYDKDLCQSFSYPVTSCEEDSENLTRVVTRDPYFYFSIPETGVTEEWVQESIDQLENLSFSCQSMELEKKQ